MKAKTTNFILTEQVLKKTGSDFKNMTRKNLLILNHNKTKFP